MSNSNTVPDDESYNLIKHKVTGEELVIMRTAPFAGALTEYELINVRNETKFYLLRSRKLTDRYYSLVRQLQPEEITALELKYG